MTKHEEMERALWELIDTADWDDLVPRLQAYTRRCLQQYGELEGRRWQTITHSYVCRAVEEVVKRGAAYAPWHAWETLFQLLCAVVRQLIDDDERKLRAILDDTNWDDLIPRVIMYTVRKLGGRIGRGKSPEDYVHEAVLQLITHRRHYPVERGISLYTFLCYTVHGMRTNDMARLAAEGQHVSLLEGNVARLAGEADDADARTLSTTGKFIDSLEPDLREYTRLRALEMYRTAKEYAAALGVPVATIRNFDRRLRRRRKRWDDLFR
jgi:DNA-directed RNA polymerase specialized sigma24 family protein